MSASKRLLMILTGMVMMGLTAWIGLLITGGETYRDGYIVGVLVMLFGRLPSDILDVAMKD